MVAMCICLGISAQWTKPAPPSSVPMKTDEALYLYNPEADGFFLGANDWDTRASVKGTKGYKVFIEKYELDDISYYLADSVETKGKIMYTFIDGVESIWVDREMESTVEKLFTFEKQSDGTYYIGLSPVNVNFNSEKYPGAYLGLIPEKNDNRIYLCDTSSYFPPYYDPELWQNKWYFVAPAEYQSYVEKKIIYEAAVALKEDIDKALAENAGIDIASVQAVYNNTSSTAEQLDAAAAALVQLVLEFQTAKASPETPADYTPYIANASYDNNNNTGWQGTAPGFQQYGNAEFYWCNYNTHQSLTGLKDGIYKVGVTAFYRAGWADNDATAYDLLLDGNDSLQHASLYATTTNMATVKAPLVFASAGATSDSLATGVLSNQFGKIPNDMHAANAYMKAGKYPETSVLVYVSDGKLTFGVKKEIQLEGDWTILDDWKLYYMGNSDEAFSYFASEYMGKSVDYEAFFEENEDVYHYKDGYTAYMDARETLASATDAISISAAMTAFDAAVKELEASIEAYAQYDAKVAEATEFIESNDNLESEEVYLLIDYLTMDEEPSESYPNGTALYILENGKLNSAQIVAEIAFLEKLLSEAIANSMVDGTDCTNLLKNASFAEDGGWNSQPGVTFPTNGIAVGEGPNMVFDVHQVLEGLQNGLYEFTVNACYQAADFTILTGEEQYKAYTYINNYDKFINSILSDPSQESAHAEDYHHSQYGYIPNSSASAYQAFSNGRYVQTVYGIVTDGTLRVGIRNDLRYDDGSRAWWTNAKLIFRAKNVEILGEVITNTLPEAKELLTNKAGQPELSYLQNAINVAEAATDEERYDALIALKQAMEDVATGTEVYAKLNTAIANLQSTIYDFSATASDKAIKKAEQLYETASAAYAAATYSTAEAIAMIDEINLAVVDMKIPDINGGGDEPIDVTSYIINPNFDPEKGDKSTGVIEGWTTSAMNGYKQNTVSYNRAAITLYQDLVGLTPGKYEVTVHTYYRAGYYDEEWNLYQQDPEQTHLTTLYAATTDERYETKVMNLLEDASDNDYGVKCYTLPNGKFAPDGTSPTVEFFNQGHYLNKLQFVVGEDGKARIGLEKTEILANDYEVVGEWNLYYLGAAEPAPVDVTSLMVNPNFDPEKGDKSTGVIEGWTTSAMNGYKQNTVSYNRAEISLYQDLVGLPAGKYKVTVNTYYRAGYYDEEWNLYQQNPELTHLTTLYAVTSDERYETKVMNLLEDASDDDYGVKCYTLPNGKFAPDGTTPTVEFFNRGHYLNELEFIVGEDGKARVGLEKKEILANDYEVVGEWHLYYLGEVEAEPETVDMTSLIVNNNFDPDRGDKSTGVIEGWTTSAMNGYKQNTVSYNRAAIELYQDLVGLPEGEYEVTVHTYYRAGYYDEEWNLYQQDPEQTHLTTLYAATTDERYETKVMNLLEDASDNDYGVKCYTLPNGKFAPDGTSPTVEFFNQGHYLNRLQFYVGSDGKARIGLEKTEILANDYEVVGKWSLYYLGKGQGVETIESEAAVIATEIYTLDGIRISAPQQGINIFRIVRADGTIDVTKVLVK